MKYVLLILLFFIGPCSRYKFKNCSDIDYSSYNYKILKKEIINDSLYLSQVYLSFPDLDMVPYDKMACSILEICRKESIIEGYFYNDSNCLYANELNDTNYVKYNGKSFYECYIGSIKVKWTKNWRQTISPYDIKFLAPPPGNVKF